MVCSETTAAATSRPPRLHARYLFQWWRRLFARILRWTTRIASSRGRNSVMPGRYFNLLLYKGAAQRQSLIESQESLPQPTVPESVHDIPARRPLSVELAGKPGR